MGDTEVPILKGVTLDISEGEFVAIVGESGSGKSTFLNILGGLMSCDKGEMMINNHHIEQMSENGLALFRRDNMGFIFQTYNLLPQLSALENIEMPLIFSGVSKRERRTRAKEMLERVGLGDRMDHKPAELSGGQQQRVSIARALINNPKLLIADEPTTALDTTIQRQVIDLFKTIIAKKDMTIIRIPNMTLIAAACPALGTVPVKATSLINIDMDCVALPGPPPVIIYGCPNTLDEAIIVISMVYSN